MKSVINLNGAWKFAPTHDQRPTNNHNVIELGIPMYAHEKLIRTGWETVPVPGVWQRYAEKYAVYEGVCWFYREFDVDALSCRDLARIVFKGVNYRADVYINNQYVGYHESGYTEFFFDISQYLRQGKNSVAVRVDNRPTEVKWPNDWGYGVFGGIHRDVFIELYRDAYLLDVRLVPDYDAEKKKAILHFSADAVGVDGVTVRLGGTETKLRAEEHLDVSIEYDLTPWTPEHPVLHAYEIVADGEVYAAGAIGFRHVCCKDKKFYLNGEEAHFDGMCYVYDSPKYGLVMAEEQLRADLSLMKAANVNAIRTHYPMSDLFYSLCDQMGFMVWIEPNIYCSKPSNEQSNTVFKRGEFVDVALRMTREMVLAAMPYASVVIYGIGNECNVAHPEAMDFFARVAEAVKTCDRTRLLGYASLFGEVGSIGSLVDIMGINSYYGWYGLFDYLDADDALFAEDGRNGVRAADVSEVHACIERVDRAIPAQMPILLTEFGGDSVPGYHSAAQRLWSENYHAEVVREYVKASLAHECVVGTFVFAFSDYSDPSKPLNGMWNGYNLKGMVSYDRTVKLPYEAIKEAYAK